MNFFYKVKFFALLLLLGALSFEGCGGKNTASFQCSGLKQLFPTLTIPLSKGQAYTLFKRKDKTEYGCMGVLWEGQTNDPPSFVMKVNSDGSYQLQNPTTKQFVAEGISGTVAAGIDKVRIVAFIMKNATPANLNCVSIIKGDLAGCWDNANCVMAWNIKDVPSGSDGPGTCQICQRELCNGKDDDCDGQVDEEVCGKVMGIPCKYAKQISGTCSGNCSCVLVGPQKTPYVCTAPKGGQLSWQPLSSVMSQCQAAKDDGKEYLCGTNVNLLCDTCEGKKVFRNIHGIGRCGSDNEFRFTDE